jgi:prepilin-type N-terminal cleavage/methylation domain-containing protein
MRCMRKNNRTQDTGHRTQGHPDTGRNKLTSDPVTQCPRKISILKRGGFTLIEILVVTVILSIVSLAIFATFNNGIKIWQRVSRLLPEEDMAIFFDRFNSDVKNSLRFGGLKLTGSEYTLQLVTLVSTSRFQGLTPGEVIYSYNQNSKVISREELDLSHIYTEEKGISARSINNIKSCRFQYYYRDKERKQYFWQDEWIKEELPLAIRLELELDDGSQIRTFTKTVSIPIAERL